MFNTILENLRILKEVKTYGPKLKMTTETVTRGRPDCSDQKIKFGETITSVNVTERKRCSDK